MRKIFLAGKVAQVGPPLPCCLVADGAAQHRVAYFERVQNRVRGHRAFDLDFDLGPNVGKILEMVGQLDADRAQFSVCTSTDFTAGRSRAIAFHESPESAEA